jgi:hypothetical protein
VKLPARSPDLIAYAERFVRTIRESCLERMILFGESAVRKVTAEFMAHYHSVQQIFTERFPCTTCFPVPANAYARVVVLLF